MFIGVYIVFVEIAGGINGSDVPDRAAVRSVGFEGVIVYKQYEYQKDGGGGTWLFLNPFGKTFPVLRLEGEMTQNLGLHEIDLSQERLTNVPGTVGRVRVIAFQIDLGQDYFLGL